MFGWSIAVGEPIIIERGPFYVASSPETVTLTRKVSGSFVADLHGVRPAAPPAPQEPQPFVAQLLDAIMEPLDFKETA